MSRWFEKTVEEVLQESGTDRTQGLTSQEAARRQDEYGLNELEDRGTKSPWKILWEQFTETMVVMLIISAVITILLGEYKDAIAILVIVVLNAILGFTQEYRAEQAMAALKKMAVPRVRVRRDGQIVEIPAQQLVPGDMVSLEAGNAIPADGSLVESVNLRVQESVLTASRNQWKKIRNRFIKSIRRLATSTTVSLWGQLLHTGAARP